MSSVEKFGKFGTLLADMLKGFQKGTATLAQAGKQGIRQMLKFIDEFLQLLKTGGKQLEAFFEKIVKDIGEWFLRNKKGFGSHAMVLEKVENGKVFLRDPLPRNYGTSYIMQIEDFRKIFKRKTVIIKK